MSVQLKFYGTEATNTNDHSLDVFVNSQLEITVRIKDESFDGPYNIQLISLDKQTAIKLSRELRKQIALLG